MTQAVAALRFVPLLPLWLLAALATAALLVGALGVLRRARGAVWRMLALALLIGWLAGPVLVRETRRPLPDTALLVLDQSASMSVGQRRAIAEAAAHEITAMASRLPDLELRQVVVPEAGQGGTRLFTAIDQALADLPRDRLAGIIAVTDGMVHDVPRVPPAAPLHVLIPARGEETDRRVRVIEAPAYGIVGHTLTLRVVVEDLGTDDRGRAAQLTIRRDGAAPVIESVPVGVEQRIPVAITRAGPTIVALSTDRLPGEVSLLNNTAVVSINGVRDRLRVLLVSGEPNPGERAWRRLLKADPSVDLVHFTILRPPDKDDPTPLNELALIAFPVRELFQEKIDQFDLIILDRFQDRGILPSLYLQNIADYVRRGGGLLLTVGPEFTTAGSLDQTPLASVLPARAPLDAGVVERMFRPVVTELGLRHPVTEGLPGANTAAPEPASAPGAVPGWGPWYRAIAPDWVEGQALMSGPDAEPLLVLHRVEKGRAALLLSDQIWLWWRGHMGGGPQAELLRRVAHWLMKEPDLEEEALSARVVEGRLLVERRSLDPAPAERVTVTAPDGSTHVLSLVASAPGRANATMPATLPGFWQVSDGTRTAFAAVAAPNPEEFADLRATATGLSGIAAASGGGVHWLVPGGAPQLRRIGTGARATGANWIGLRRNGAHIVTGVASTPLLPPWLALPLLLAAVMLAWWRESAT